MAGELILSFVPDPEQRAWRTLTRSKQQLVRDRVRLQNQLEALLEEARIKLSSVISDLLGASGRRILEALAGGETDPGQTGGVGRLSAEVQPGGTGRCPAGARAGPMHAEMLKLYLERLELLDRQIAGLDRMAAQALKKHEEAVIRLAQVPGLGADSAQQIIAEAGVDVKAFHFRARNLPPGWAPSREARKARKRTTVRGPRRATSFLRRILTQAAQAAVKKKNRHFQLCSAD